MSPAARLLGWLLPREERPLILRELDELARRRGTGGRGFRGFWWQTRQILSFAFWLRVEGIRDIGQGFGPLLSDFAVTVRVLFRRPGYLMACILVVGIGTGGLAAVYGTAEWVIFRDVPGVGDPDRLVWLRLESSSPDWGTGSWGIKNPDLEGMAARMPSLQTLVGARKEQVHLSVPSGDRATREAAWLVTPGYFDALEIRPAAGRFFSAADHRGNEGPSEVVVAHRLWERLWGRSRSAIGSRLLVNGRLFTVVGVAPRGFLGAELPGEGLLWFTTSAFGVLHPSDADKGIDQATQLWDPLFGRRRPGVSVERVQEEANAAMEAIRGERSGQWHSFMATHFVFRAYEGVGLDPRIRPRVTRTLTILLGASLFLFFLAVANVANLGLTRASSRRGASAIRRALGAGSWRVAREPLNEGLLIGAGGGVVGLLLFLMGSRILSGAHLAPGGASLTGMSMDGRIVLVALASALLAGLAGGVIPALSVSREKVLDGLNGLRGTTPGVTRLRSALVVGQVALSGILIVGAGLLMRTVLELNGTELGIPRDAYTFSIDPGLNNYGETDTREILSEVQRDLEARFGALAGGIVFPNPLSGWRITGAIRLPGAPETHMTPGSTFWTSGNGFFRGAGMELLAGEGFVQTLEEPESAVKPVVINESMARAAFPEAPYSTLIGQPVFLGREEGEHTITGVVRDARILSPEQEPSPVIFREYDPAWAEGSATFYLRSGLPPAETRAAVEADVALVDENLPVFDASTVEDRVAALLSERIIVARLASILGCVGLVLVYLGLQGVLTYTVQARTRELGVRVAMGASATSLRLQVLRQGLRLVLAGLLLGLPLAWAVTRLMESRLFGVGVLDPPVYAAGVALMVTAALTASWVPAHRATRISPMDALREE